MLTISVVAYFKNTVELGIVEVGGGGGGGAGYGRRGVVRGGRGRDPSNSWETAKMNAWHF